MSRPRATISPQDRQEIYDVILEHCWCLDTGDGERLAELFTPDGTIETHAYTRDGREEILNGYRQGPSSQPGFQGRQHHANPCLVWDHPDGGYEVMSYWYVTQSTVADGAVLRLHGYAFDRFVKHEGRWLMKSKQVLPWNTETAPMHEAFERLQNVTA